jgi:hypothetical protein
MKLLHVFVSAAAVCCGGIAQATTLTFNDLAPQTGPIGQTYSADGFDIIGTGPSYAPNASFYIFGPGSPQWTGTPGITLFAVSGIIKLRTADQSLFNLQSIDLARGDSNGGLIPVGFTGYRADGTIVQAVYRFTDSIVGRNETFTFGSNFQSLTSVVWYQGAEWHQFDNIQVSSAVPEPATVSLLLLGTFLLGAIGKKNPPASTSEA